MREILPRHFDLIVISAANFISAKKELSKLRDALNAIGDSVPMIVLGAGMQGKPELSQMHPSVQEILDIYNRRTLIFGVRGLQTEAWLHDNGFTNARALGCPSMYVFPSSIMSIRHEAAAEKLEQANVLTAGYLTVKGGRNYFRGQKLAKALQGIQSSYVFQDEFFAYGSLIEERGSFNSATSTGNRDRLNVLLSEATEVPVNFSNYYYFSETAAWRQAAHMHDVYIGDRFHGGVAALQVGKPGIFLSHDNRVAELTDFFDLPRMSTDELLSEGVSRAIKERITKGSVSQTQATYKKRLSHFRDAMEKKNIKLVPAC